MIMGMPQEMKYFPIYQNLLTLKIYLHLPFQTLQNKMTQQRDFNILFYFPFFTAAFHYLFFSVTSTKRNLSLCILQKTIRRVICSLVSVSQTEWKALSKNNTFQFSEQDTSHPWPRNPSALCCILEDKMNQIYCNPLEKQ